MKEFEVYFYFLFHAILETHLYCTDSDFILRVVFLNKDKIMDIRPKLVGVVNIRSYFAQKRANFECLKTIPSLNH